MQDFMPHHSHTAIFTTVSGVVGGVGKAVTAKPLLLAITLPGLTTVVLYAAASATAGYVYNTPQLLDQKVSGAKLIFRAVLCSILV